MTERRPKPKEPKATGARAATAVAALAATALLLPAAAPAVAGPPDWAPAHGWRAKHHGPRDRHARTAYVVLPAVPPRHAGRSAPDTAFCNRDLIGAAIGGGLGGLAGSRIGSGSGRTVAIVVGTVAGGLLGGSIGRAMDRADAACVARTLEYAPTGRTVAWRNPDADAAYAVTPVRTWQAEAGRYCREYTTTATVGGREERVYGTACRQPDGAWRIES
jgi:surface antigen